MKKIISTIFISLLAFNSIFAQKKIVPLKQLKNDVIITVKDSAVIITNENKEFSFKIKKEKDKRHYEFANPSADSNAFYELLSIDKIEINDKYYNALPNISAAQQLITVAADEPDGIFLKKTEDSSVVSSSDHNQELGGQDIRQEKTDKKNSFMDILLYGIPGFIIGLLVMFFNRKKPQVSPQPEEEITDTSDEINTDIVSIDKLTAQVKKYRDENKKIKAELKKINTDFEKNISEFKNHDAFLNAYFNNAFNDFIKPFNEANEKNDQEKAFQLLFKMSAHFSSLTKHELRVKQSFDTNNIAHILKEKNPNLTNVETVNASTPKDIIPKNIKTIISMMDKVGIDSLGESILYGYKIQKDK